MVNHIFHRILLVVKYTYQWNAGNEVTKYKCQ